MGQQVFLLPDVGEGLIEADIVTWKVQVGDVVQLNQPLCDVETAKATVELPSPFAGRVTQLHANVGDTVEVHTPLVTFEVEGAGEVSAAPVSPTSASETPSPAPAAAPAASPGVTGGAHQQVFLLPDVGEGLIEADIVTWKVQVGDVVQLNQPLCDVETAKATVELPSPFAGRVTQLHANEGDTVEVHTPLVTFEVEGAVEAPAAPHGGEKHVVNEPDEQRREPVLIGYGVANEDGVAVRKHRRRSSSGAAPAAQPSAAAPLAPRATGPVRTTPPVRLLAKTLGVDLTSVVGTGREGVVTRADVELAVQSSGSGTPSPVATRVATVPTGPSTTSRFVGRELASWNTGEREERIAVKGVLKAMAESMTESMLTHPQAAVWVRVDATKTMELVAGLKKHPRLQGVRLSPLVIVALALVDAARHYPGVNSMFDAASHEVVVKRYVNLGIAADTPKGLLVPNIKDADQLDLVGMANALSVLVEKARAGTTSLAEMTGTTLTITNVGPMGVDSAIPILPPGTGAILAIGRIAPAPWVVDGEVVARQVAELALTFDHRQIDGALASNVLAYVAKFLEDPATALVAGI